MAEDRSLMSEMRVAGRVVDEKSGRGLAGIGVSGGLEVTTTDVNGHYELTVDPTRRTTTLVAVTVPASWRARLGPFGAPECYQRVDGSGGSAVADQVTAIDVSSGQIVWRCDAGGPVLSSPVVSGDLLYVAANDGRLRALARDTGECRWSYDLGSWLIAAPVVTGNTVVMGAWDGNVYAFTRPGVWPHIKTKIDAGS